MRIRSKDAVRATTIVLVIWLIGVGLAASGVRDSTRWSSASLGHSARGNGAEAMPSIAKLWTLPFQAAQAGGQRPAAAGQKLPVMVEDVFTNVQALKGISVDEFMGTMGLMSAALSFCCNDCHNGAGTDQVVWAADNPVKRTARKMVFMVQAINKESFNGRQIVTCWTCHRGRDKPVMTPGLDQVYSEPTIYLDDVLVKAPRAATPEAIIDKYLGLIGGAQKLGTITSVTATGKSTGYGGFGGGGQVEFVAQAPDKRALYIRFPDDPERGDNTRTFDGKTGWIATPLAVVRKYPLTAGELDGARLDAQLTFPAQFTKVLTNLRAGPPTEVNGRSLDTVQGNGARNSIATLFFDHDTGMLVRIVRFTPSAIGKVPTQVDYSDYRDVGGIKFPYKWTFAWLDGRDTIELTNVQFNQRIDASKFGEPTPVPSAKN